MSPQHVCAAAIADANWVAATDGNPNGNGNNNTQDNPHPQNDSNSAPASAIKSQEHVAEAVCVPKCAAASYSEERAEVYQPYV